MDTEECMITTIDNPYDPFTQFDEWFEYDESNGYCSCGLLARLALTSASLSDEENLKEINHAIDDILNLFPGLYIKVTPGALATRTTQAMS